MSKRLLQRLQKVDHFIRRRSTGTAEELGQKLEVSARTAKEVIATMREFGAPVYFDRQHNSYCYSEDGRFLILFSS